MEKVKVGIMGGAGYTGGELLRLLLNHDQVQIAFVQSRSQAGKPVHQVHTDLRGVSDLSFTDDAQNLKDPSLQVVFLALPHGEARKWVQETELSKSVRLIDLSNDFRLSSRSTLGSRSFVYGLPELNREAIQKARSIANPGCFATAIELALLPLGLSKKIAAAYVTGITGSTGAGQKLSETTHFSFRANNVQAYKTLTHQHVAEIEQTLGAGVKVAFVPWRGDFTRGIFVSATVECRLSQKEALDLYREFYRSHPFVCISADPIDLKSVVNTNRALIEILSDGGQLVIHSAIDNLLKGASGQAVQNLNLMMGWKETLGLMLKGSAF